MNIFCHFTFNIIVNSFLAFVTTCLLIEALVFICRIPRGRLSAYIRIIPLLKLPVDLLSYNFSSWCYLQNINPTDCEEGSRQLCLQLGLTDCTLFSVIQLKSKDCTFSTGDLLVTLIPDTTLKLIVITTLLLSSFLLTRKVMLFSKPHSFPYSPTVVGHFSPIIYFPEKLRPLFTSQEYEAILQHEYAHIKYKDNFTRLLLNVICSIFWWIPTHALLKTIEEDQEIGCDKEVIDPEALASALYKTVLFNKESKTPLGATFSAHPLRKRLEILLNKQHSSYFLPAVGVGVATFIIFPGKYWIF